MKSIVITIELGNDAFDPEPHAEVQRLLREEIPRYVCETLSDGISRQFRDINGNPVGFITPIG